MKPHQPRQYIERVNRIYHDKANKIVADMVIYQKASEIKLTHVPSDHWDNEAWAHIQNSLKPKKTFEDMERLMRGIYDTK